MKKTIACLFVALVATTTAAPMTASATLNGVGPAQLPGLAGIAADCECTGAGRTASCQAPCSCDYDWQGYPRCTSTAQNVT